MLQHIVYDIAFSLVITILKRLHEVCLLLFDLVYPLETTELGLVPSVTKHIYIYRYDVGCTVDPLNIKWIFWDYKSQRDLFSFEFVRSLSLIHESKYLLLVLTWNILCGHYYKIIFKSCMTSIMDEIPTCTCTWFREIWRARVWSQTRPFLCRPKGNI